MRLSDYEITAIKKAFIEIFEDGKVYLFGSRVDDSKRGGDIDLYIVPDKKFEDERERKIKFLIKLDKYLGEQKIDVILAKDKNKLIEQEALRTGVDLMSLKTVKIDKYINECKKHQMWIEESFSEIQDIFPLSGKKYTMLTTMEIKNIDQFLFRFSKMQDTVGEKLFRLIVKDFVEDTTTMTFIDILNQLERIKIIDSVQEWQNLRKARNDISHQYDDEPEEMAEAINRIFAQKDILIDIFNNIKNYYIKQQANKK
jgi:predicted nucleotidyltransferase